MNTCPTRATHQLGWLPRVGAAALALGALTGCGSAHSATTAANASAPSAGELESATERGSDTGTATDIGVNSHPETSGTLATSSRFGKTAEEAAQNYMNALMIGHYNSAAAWVVPEEQGIVKALGLGRGPGTLPTLSGSVRVADVVPTGTNTAYATLVGTMCRTASAPGKSTPKPECISNKNPASNLPYFTVHLIETHPSGWKVYFHPQPARDEQ